MKNKYLQGLVLIFFIYSFFKILQSDYTDQFLTIDRKIRHILKLISILSVYIIGVIQLKKIEPNWYVIIWNFIYISTIIFLLTIGFYDWLFELIPIHLRILAKTLQEFIISPLIYLILPIFKYKIDNK